MPAMPSSAVPSTPQPSPIVAGRFDTFAAAETTASRLFSQGFSRDDVSMFFVNPPGQHARFPIGGDQAADPGARRAGAGAERGLIVGAVAGAAIGAGIVVAAHASMLVLMLAIGVGTYLGSLVGALVFTRHLGRNRMTQQKPVRDAGVLLAVRVASGNTDEAVRVLRSAGARDVERATGHWEGGRWIDFDPLVPPVPVYGSQRDAANA